MYRSTTFDNISLPPRVLPVSTEVPKDLPLILDEEIDVIQSLLARGNRRTLEAKARLRALAIAESATQGEYLQPAETELNRLVRQVKNGAGLFDLFPGIGSLATTVDGAGVPYFIRIAKKAGAPVTIVPEGTPGARPLALKRVSELDYYNLKHTDLAKHCGLTAPKLTAIVRYLKLKEDKACFKVFKVGGMQLGQYSQEALKRISEALPNIDMDEIWRKHGPRRRGR